MRIVRRDRSTADATSPRIAADEGHVGRLDGHVGAGPDGDAEVRPGEGRGVVDAVADHRHALAGQLEPLHRGRLLGRQHLGEDVLGGDAGAPADRFRGGSGVPGDEPRIDAQRRAVGRPRPPPPGLSGSARTRSPASPAIDRQPGGRPSLGSRAIAIGRPGASVADVALGRGIARCRPTTARARRRSPRPRGRRRPRTRSTDGSRARRAGPGRRSRRRAGARCRARRKRQGRAARPTSQPAAGTISTTAGRPIVSVPVLSKTTVSMRMPISSASPPSMRMPASAPRPVPTMIAVGVASPIAHGQATMSDGDRASQGAKVSRGSGPRASQAANVAAADDEDERHEHLADPVGHPLDRRLASPGPAGRARRSGPAPCRGRPGWPA